MAEPGASATHWLLLPDPLKREETEALVISRASGAAWIDERTIGWEPGVLLQGPLTREELASGGELPDWVGGVYAATSPRERGQAIPPELRVPGGVLAAFPEGEPTGIEREALETLEAFARRMGGGVLTETGLLVVPEPRFDLVLFSSEWIAAADLSRFLSSIGDFETLDEPVLPPELHDPGYALIAHVEGGAVISVTASEADVIPLAFAGYGWAAEAVYVYEFRYFPPQSFVFSAPTWSTPAEAAATVDGPAAHLIERIAATTLRAVGERGHVCDDDGFLVLLT